MIMRMFDVSSTKPRRDEISNDVKKVNTTQRVPKQWLAFIFETDNSY